MIKYDDVSIDKISIISNLNLGQANTFEKFMFDVIDPGLTYNNMNLGNFKYKYSWTYKGYNEIKKVEYTIFVGFNFNSYNNERIRELRVEFNPNKVDVMNEVYQVLRHYIGNNYKIQKFDVAFDYQGLHISEVTFDKKNKYVDTIEEGEGKTIYIGKGNGRCRIYNKAVEQKISDKKWTRIEYTIKINEMSENIVNNGLVFNFELVDIYKLVEYDSSLLEDEKNKVALQCMYMALQREDIQLADIPYKSRVKIKKLLESNGSCSKVDLEKIYIYSALIDYILKF